MPDNTTSGRGRPSKVVRLIDQYELHGVGAEMEAEWTKDHSERRSLRDLADDFNKKFLRQVVLDANVQTLDGEVENFYRLLTDDETSAADRTRAHRRLEQAGIDTEELTSDFVSYQAIRTYLQNYRGVSYEPDDKDPVRQLQSVVTQLQNKLVTISESRLDRFSEKGTIEISNPTVIANVQITCTGCSRQIDIDELSNDVRCDCSEV